MKKLLGIVSFFLLLPGLTQAQILKPVTWNYSAKKIGDGQYILHMTALIDPGWHVYAQNAGEGPIPTSFKFVSGPGTQFTGTVREVGKMEKAFDKNFNSILKYYEHKVDFVQYVKVKPGTTSVKGSLEFMVCDNHECLPPKDLDFVIKL